jgi:hypothetical protein
MAQEDDFLVSKYVEYRKAFHEAKVCAPFMPYGWFTPPQTIRLDTKFGLQQMAYRVSRMMPHATSQMGSTT